MKPSDADPVPFRLFNEIGIIEHLARTEFERVLPPGLSVASFSVLNHFVRLNKQDEAPNRLASAFQVTKGAMTNTLQRLEALGLVQIAPDPEDGRGKRVSITQAGRAARDEAIGRLAPLLAEFSSVISSEEAAVLLPLLVRLRTYLDARRD